MSFFTLAAAGSLLLAPLAPENRLVATVDGWRIFTIERGCALATTFEGETTLHVLFEPRSDDATVGIFDPSFRSLKSGDEHRLDVTILSRGRVVGSYESVKFTALETEDKRPGISALFAGGDVLGDLAAGSTLVVMRGDTLVTSLNLDGSAKAIARMRDCAWKVERENPSDPFEGSQPAKGTGTQTGAALAQPVGTAQSWVTADDYPPAALQAKLRGTVIVQLQISAIGRVENCAVEGSSGHPELDDATCRLVVRRGRFKPATDAHGQAVPSTYKQTYRWVP